MNERTQKSIEQEYVVDVFLYDCQDLLQEIAIKYPKSLNNVLSSLKKIKRVEDLYKTLEEESPTEKEERKQLALNWLERIKEYE